MNVIPESGDSVTAAVIENIDGVNFDATLKAPR